MEEKPLVVRTMQTPNNKARAFNVSPPKLSYEIGEYRHPSSLSTQHDRKKYDWAPLLDDPDFSTAPLSSFRHAPMSECWDCIAIGMKVEVQMPEGEGPNDSCWIATIVKICGYLVKVRMDGCIPEDGKDFWLHLFSNRVHPVGWCFHKYKTLTPPKCLEDRYSDWKEFITRRLPNTKTLPKNFYARAWLEVKSKFKPGMTLEVVDKLRISRVRVAKIVSVTGKRLCVRYIDGSFDDDTFWCHQESQLVHPVGWAHRIGHDIDASDDYLSRCEEEIHYQGDCTPDMFPDYDQPTSQFEVGMKLEAVDPLNLASICVATVMKVLKFGYMMLRIESYEDTTGSDWFCSHVCSPLIFPPGFCELNGITLSPPSGYEKKFLWSEYLKESKSTRAPSHLFIPRSDTKHLFKIGMKLEVTDAMEPRTVCVSTVTNVIDRLIRIHFDGWEDDYDQWMDSESVDIFPVGWSELVGHTLQSPRVAQPEKKKEKKKSLSKKAKKRSGTPTSNGVILHKKPKIKIKPPPEPAFTKHSKPKHPETSELRIKMLPPPPIPPLKISSPTFSETGERIFRIEPSAKSSKTSSTTLTFKTTFFKEKKSKTKSKKSSKNKKSSKHVSSKDPSTTFSRHPKIKIKNFPFINPDTDTIDSSANIGESSPAGTSDLPSASVTPPQSANNVSHSETKISPSTAIVSPSHSSKTVVHPSSPLTSVISSSSPPNSVSPSLRTVLTIPLPGSNKSPSLTSGSPSSSSSAQSANTLSPVSNNSNNCSHPEGVSSVSPSTNKTVSLTVRGSTMMSPTIDGSSKATPSATNLLSISINSPNSVGGKSPIGSSLSSPASMSNDLLTIGNNVPPATHKSPRDGNPSSPTVKNEPLTSPQDVKVIPRLVDSAGQTAVQRSKDSNLDPSTWSVDEVAQFLQINECQSLADAFTQQSVDGGRFLSLDKSDIMKLVNNKIGPCLKVENLLTLLKARMNPAQARFLATIRKSS